MDGPMTIWPGTRPGYITPDEAALTPFIRTPMFGGYSGIPYTGRLNVDLGSIGPLVQILIPQLLQSLTGREQQLFQFFPQQSIYDQMRAYEFFLGNREAMQLASQRDTVAIGRMIGGVTQMFTGQPLTEQQQARSTQIAQTLSQWMPLLTQLIGPDLIDQLHGSRGSAAIMAQQLHHTLRASIDPVTGRIGYSGIAAGRVTQELYERLFGEETSLTAMRGLSAGQAGMLANELQVRGLLGRPIGALPIDERRTQLPDTLSDSQVSRLAMQLPRIQAMLQRGETPSETAMEAARQTIRSTHATLKDNTRILSDEDLRQLEGADQLISAADADRIQRRLENMAGAVKAMRDIFGDMGNPNAPMREIINGLDQLTQGGLATMSASEIEQTVRRTHALAQQTGVGIPGMMALMSQGGLLADQLGLNRSFAVSATQQAAAFGAAAGDVLRLDRPVWDAQTKEQMTLLDQQLRLHAAASPMSEQLGAVMRMVDTGMATPAAGSELEAIVQAIQQQKTTYTYQGQERPLQMDRIRMQQILARDAGLSVTETHSIFADRLANQEFIDRHNIPNITRQAMPQDAVRLQIAPVLSNRFGGLFREHELTQRLIEQGVLADENDARAFAVEIGREVGQRFLTDRETITPDVIRDPAALRRAAGKLVRDSLAERLRQRQPELTEPQIDQQVTELVEQLGGEERLPVIGEVVISAMNTSLASTPFRNMRNWWEMSSPDVMEQQAVHMRQAQMTGIIQSSLSHLGNTGPAARLADALQKATSETTLAQVLTQTFGAIPETELVGADPTGAIAQMLQSAKQLKTLDPRNPEDAIRAAQLSSQLTALVMGGQTAQDEADALEQRLQNPAQFKTPEQLEEAKQMLQQLQNAAKRGPDHHILGARGVAALAAVSQDDIRAIAASGTRAKRYIQLQKDPVLQELAAAESERLGREISLQELLKGGNGLDDDIVRQAGARATELGVPSRDWAEDEEQIQKTQQRFLSQVQGLSRRLITDNYSMQLLGSGGVALATDLADAAQQLQQLAAEESKRTGRTVTVSQLLQDDGTQYGQNATYAQMYWDQLHQTLGSITDRYQYGLPAGVEGPPENQLRAPFTEMEEKERQALAKSITSTESPEERAERILQRLSQRATTEQAAILKTESVRELLQPSLLSNYRAQRLEHALYSQEAIWNMAIDKGMFGEKTSVRDLTAEEKEQAFHLLDNADITAEERQQLYRWHRFSAPLQGLTSELTPEDYLFELQQNIQSLPSEDVFGQLEKPQSITAKVTGSVTVHEDGTADLALEGDGVMDHVTRNIGMA